MSRRVSNIPVGACYAVRMDTTFDQMRLSVNVGSRSTQLIVYAQLQAALISSIGSAACMRGSSRQISRLLRDIYEARWFFLPRLRRS